MEETGLTGETTCQRTGAERSPCVDLGEERNTACAENGGNEERLDREADNHADAGEQEAGATQPKELPESGQLPGDTRNLGWDASEMAQRGPSRLAVGGQFIRITDQRRNPTGFYSSQLKKMRQGGRCGSRAVTSIS